MAKPDPIGFIQQNADKEARMTMWAYQLTVINQHAYPDSVPPNTVYETAQGAVNALMRAYDLKAPLCWTVDTPLSIEADFQNMIVCVFGMHVATPEDPKP